MAKCKACGSRISDGAEQCPACGARFTKRTEETPTYSVRSAPVQSSYGQGQNTRNVPAVKASNDNLDYGNGTAYGGNNRGGQMSSDDLIAFGENLLANNPSSSQKEQAFDCFQRALGMGNKNAHLSLGFCYLDGIGTEEDRERAFHHFYEAHDAGNYDGTAMMGACYYYGVGTEVHEKRGKRYLKDARDSGSSIAKSFLKKIKKEEKKEEEMENSRYIPSQPTYNPNQGYDDAMTGFAIGAGAVLAGMALADLFG